MTPDFEAVVDRAINEWCDNPALEAIGTAFDGTGLLADLRHLVARAVAEAWEGKLVELRAQSDVVTADVMADRRRAVAAEARVKEEQKIRVQLSEDSQRHLELAFAARARVKELEAALAAVEQAPAPSPVEGAAERDWPKTAQRCLDISFIESESPGERLRAIRDNLRAALRAVTRPLPSRDEIAAIIYEASILGNSSDLERLIDRLVAAFGERA